jgi:5'-deoxynucleotidase YfbR-like HD superfamily hydrolase
MEPWIITQSGVKFDLLNTTTYMINIKDIAHALSNVCRFGGHSCKHYSVAQHSVLASYIVSDEFKLCALMHDATEAYIGDMVSPLKAVIPQFKEIEQNLWEVIAKKYNLPKYLPEEVKLADMQMLKAEKKYLLPETDPWDFLEGIRETNLYIEPWTSEYSNWRFMQSFKELT